MKRPFGVTIIALLSLVLGLAWLLQSGPQFGELFKDVSKPDPWGAKWRGLLAAWTLLWATVFLTTGLGLWRRRKWARVLTAVVGVLISAALLVDFYRWPSTWGRDYIDQWDYFAIGWHFTMLAPYYLVTWPIWEVIDFIFPDRDYFVQVIASYFLGGLGYVGVARYMLSTRVKQAFGADS